MDKICKFEVQHAAQQAEAKKQLKKKKKKKRKKELYVHTCSARLS